MQIYCRFNAIYLLLYTVKKLFYLIKIKKMRKEEILILEREDMIETKNSKSILLIDFTDFKISVKPLQENEIVLFIDNNGQTKILKNRYGDKGNGMFIETIEDMKQNSIDNELGYGEEYFDQIISLYSK
jgi:hypothetical protein